MSPLLPEPQAIPALTQQQREARRRNCGRLIGVFGHREMEVAAIAILDAQWDRPFDPINADIFTDEDARNGFRDLQRSGWVDGPRPTRAFWRRVHGR